MTAQQQEHVDTFYRTFHRTPFVPQSCTLCHGLIFTVKDDDGTTHVLDNSQPVFVQIKDSESNEQTVMRVTGFTEHTLICMRTVRRDV